MLDITSYWYSIKYYAAIVLPLLLNFLGLNSYWSLLAYAYASSHLPMPMPWAGSPCPPPMCWALGGSPCPSVDGPPGPSTEGPAAPAHWRGAWAQPMAWA